MIQTRFTVLFGIEYPILNAPMAGAATAELAAAVSAAGGLGMICASRSASFARAPTARSASASSPPRPTPMR